MTSTNPALPFLKEWLYSQLFVTLPYPTKQFTGQAIIVTGSNSGLGYEAAHHFVRLNAEKVILAVRNPERGETAKKSIEKSTGRTSVVEVWQLDLASYESVKQFAARAEGLKRLDIVMENAGILTNKFTTMEDNESTITTNVISTFLLALLLLPKLRETAVKFNVLPRLVIVASFVHYFTELSEKNSDNILEKLGTEEGANMDDRYNVSKLIEIFAIRELGGLMDSSAHRGRVVLNCLNPGFCRTEIVREYNLIQTMVFTIFRAIFSRTTEQGSRTLIAAAEGGEETHGQYMNDCRVGTVAPFVSSEEGADLQKRLWTELSQKLDAIQPGILQNI